MPCHPSLVEHWRMAARKTVPTDTQKRNTAHCTADPVDEMLSRYVDWREHAAATKDAYRQWSRAARAETNRRLAAYLAALDLEESAAGAYALAVAEVQHALQTP